MVEKLQGQLSAKEAELRAARRDAELSGRTILAMTSRLERAEATTTRAAMHLDALADETDSYAERIEAEYRRGAGLAGASEREVHTHLEAQRELHNTLSRVADVLRGAPRLVDPRAAKEKAAARAAASGGAGAAAFAFTRRDSWLDARTAVASADQGTEWEDELERARAEMLGLIPAPRSRPASRDGVLTTQGSGSRPMTTEEAQRPGSKPQLPPQVGREPSAATGTPEGAPRVIDAARVRATTGGSPQHSTRPRGAPLQRAPKKLGGVSSVGRRGPVHLPAMAAAGRR